MIKLSYSKDEMIAALKKIGYEVKEETEIEMIRGYYEQVDEQPRKVLNCYYKGNRIDLWDYLYGTQRLENVFEMEVRKKIYKLF
jgi:hypothetical protein